MPQTQRPAQQQNPPGTEKIMTPHPQDKRERGVGCDKLLGKVAIITGGDSGIGRATAIASFVPMGMQKWRRVMSSSLQTIVPTCPVKCSTPTAVPS